MAFLRFTFILLVVLTVIYVSLSMYARATRRERLERDWDNGSGTGDRDSFVSNGMAEFEPVMRRNLILGVYVAPILAISVVIYLSNNV